MSSTVDTRPITLALPHPGRGRPAPEPAPPLLRVLPAGPVVPVTAEVTTVGRGPGVDLLLRDDRVSPLHAELVRRGPHVHVSDLGLSRAGTRVNGTPVARRVLADGDVLGFGLVRVRVTGLAPAPPGAVAPLHPAQRTPDLTPRELDVLASLCRPARSGRAFVAPATVAAIARELVVTEAAVKQHLARLYTKFRVHGGTDRRVRLANAALESGAVTRAAPPVDGRAWTVGEPPPAVGGRPRDE